jgi:uncharacterized protein
MDETCSHFTLNGKSPMTQLLISLLTILLVGMFLFSCSMLAGTLIFGQNLIGISGGDLADIGEKDIGYLRYLLISQDISLFIIPAIILLSLMNPVGYKIRLNVQMLNINEIFLVILLAFCLFPITGFTGQLNSFMHFPDWLSGVGEWITEKEEYATHLTNTLIISDTFGIMLFNLLMIAIIPAVGEEFIFRGVFQKIFYGLFKSGHVAVWVAAFLFSLMHFQFFGFLPRFILGLVFGYLYLWSGTLWLPVIAHFINNAVPTIAAYFRSWETVSGQTDIALWKQLIFLPVPVLISLVILLYFRNKSGKEEQRFVDNP